MATKQSVSPRKQAGLLRRGIARHQSLGWVGRAGLQSPSPASVQVACILSSSAPLSVKWADVAAFLPSVHRL